MSIKILLTSTSFQDTKGSHHDLLASTFYDVIKMRGPLKEIDLIGIIQNFDGIICGDDEITENVIFNGVNGKLKVISKYGSGLDKIDLDAARKYNLPVMSCPGVNQTTVAEHIFALLLSFVKNIIPENEYIRQEKWIRLIGTELFGKNIGIIGLGNVGKEVAKRATAFGMNVFVFDKKIDNSFLHLYNINALSSLEELLTISDFISLNASLTSETKNLINFNNINLLKKGVVILNVARAGLVEEDAIIFGLENSLIGGYLADVLNDEPMIVGHPYLKYSNVIITPHIGSRTYENVVKQGEMAVNNLISFFNK